MTTLQSNARLPGQAGGPGSLARRRLQLWQQWPGSCGDASVCAGMYVRAVETPTRDG